MIPAFIILVVLVAALGFYLVLFIIELDYARRLNQWEHERFKYIEAVFVEIHIITSVPNHTTDLVSTGGNIMAQGTVLNFDALKTMTRVMLEQENDRRDAQSNITRALAELGQWERENPQPDPPTYFGRRFGFFLIKH